MSPFLNVTNNTCLFHCRFDIVQSADIFTRRSYRDIVVESLNFCVENKGLKIHAYVFLSNQIQCLLSTTNVKLSNILRDFKSFSAKRLFEEMLTNNDKRKSWLTLVFKYAAGGHSRNKDFQIWSHDNHPLEIWGQEQIQDTLNEIHRLPVAELLCVQPEHWVYSSAVDYARNTQTSPIKILFLNF